MQTSNPYLVDEIVTQTDRNSNVFGLIGNSESNNAERHGYEITMSGKVVLPELMPRLEGRELGRPLDLLYHHNAWDVTRG